MAEETTVFRGTPSLLTRTGPISLASAVLVGAVAGMVWLRNGQPAMFWILAVAVAVAIVYLVAEIVVVKTTEYELTTERLRIRRGILTKRTEELELYRANDTSLIEPLVLRLFGCGTIEIRTMDEDSPIVEIEAVHGARALRERLRTHIEECRDRKRVRVAELDEHPAL